MSGIELGLAGNVSLCCVMGLVGKYPKYVPKYSKYVTAPCRGGGGGSSSLAAAKARWRWCQWWQCNSVTVEAAAVAAWWQRGANPLEGRGGSLHYNCKDFFYHTIEYLKS